MRRLLLTLLGVSVIVAALYAASASDNFNRFDSGTLGSNWADPETEFGIASNQAEQTNLTTDTHAFAWWKSSVTAIGADQFAQVTCATFAGNACGVSLRMSGTTWGTDVQGYACDLDGFFNAYNILKLTAGGPAFSTLANGAATVSDGDVVYCQIVGTTITLKQNGTTIATATDSGFATGQPGLMGLVNFSAGTTRWEDWSGGDVSAGAVFPAGILNNPIISCCRGRSQ